MQKRQAQEGIFYSILEHKNYFLCDDCAAPLIKSTFYAVAYACRGSLFPGAACPGTVLPFPNYNVKGALPGLQKPSFEVIFTTAYDHYAVKAIKYSALDYLLKPIDADEMKASVSKA